MKKRVEMIEELYNSQLENLIQMEVETVHGERMEQAFKGQEKSAQLTYNIRKELNRLTMEMGRRRVAINILADMLKEEKENPKPIESIVNPPALEEKPEEPKETPKKESKKEKK